MSANQTNISELTSTEVCHLIFGDTSPDTPCPMPMWIAIQVITMEHLDAQLKDWAWLALAAEMDAN